MIRTHIESYSIEPSSFEILEPRVSPGAIWLASNSSKVFGFPNIYRAARGKPLVSVKRSAETVLRAT